MCRKPAEVRAVREVDRFEPAARGIEQLERVARAARDEAGDPPVGEEGIALAGEHPPRQRELGFCGSERPHVVAAGGIQVPPPGPVGDEVEHSVGTPPRIDDRLRLSAGDHPFVAEGAVLAERGDAELRAVERHARVVPGEPGELRAGRIDPWRRVEIVAGRDHTRLGGSVRWKGDELVQHLAALVALAHADDQTPVRREKSVGVAQRMRLRRLRRHGPSLRARLV